MSKAFLNQWRESYKNMVSKWGSDQTECFARSWLSQLKDPILANEQNGVVYRISCKDCSKVYIGQSGRFLACQMKEHRRAVQNGDTNSSAVAEHAWQNLHHVDWEAAEVIDSSSDWYPRCLLESWHIHWEPDPMNRESGPLPQIYCALLSEQKHK